MRKLVTSVAIAIISFSQLQAQSNPEPSSSGRKATTRIAPNYPEFAKRMHIQGTVRVEAVVRPRGSVKSTRGLGGSPVLAEAATNPIDRWKFEPRQNETTELVGLTFAPHE